MELSPSRCFDSKNCLEQSALDELFEIDDERQQFEYQLEQFDASKPLIHRISKSLIDAED